MISKLHKKKKALALQLTSLLDMFTIILVFLMVSFQTQDKDFVLHAGLKLPPSSAKSAFKTAVNVAVTMDKIYVEGKVAYLLAKGGRVHKRHLKLRKLNSITRAIKLEWKKRKKESDVEQVVVIQADKKVPYRTLHTLMRSAAYAGFFRFRLVIEKE